MIKDFYLEKEISNFAGGEKIFAVNSIYYPEKNLKNLPENVIVSKTLKGIFTLDEEYADDNVYPYQALLFHIAEQLKNGIIIAEYPNETRIVTAVKNGIPVLSNTIITADTDAFQAQLSRFAVANETGETAMYITEKDYNLKFIKTPFLTAEELSQLEKKSFIKDKLLVYGSIILLIGYCFNAIPSTLEYKKLTQEIEKLEMQKQSLAKNLIPAKSELKSIDIKTLENENQKTQEIIESLSEIAGKEPILKIKDATGNILTVTDFSPNFKENLAKFNPKYTKNVLEATIEIKIKN